MSTVQEDFKDFRTLFSQGLDLKGVLGATIRKNPPEILVLVAEKTHEIINAFPDIFRYLPVRVVQMKRMFRSEKEGVKMLCGQIDIGGIGLVSFCQKTPEKEEASCETTVVQDGKLYEDAKRVFKDLGYDVSETEEAPEVSKTAESPST